MDLLLRLVLGLVAGVLGMLAVYRAIPSTPMAWIGAVVVGLIGGWLGGLLANVLGLTAVNWIGSLFVAFVGVVLVLLLLRSMTPHARA